MNLKPCTLVIPAPAHEQAYTNLMNRWETLEENIQPQLLRRGSVSYSRWLEWCEDDRTTGSMLSTHIPCTLYFLLAEDGEILGGIVINHENTRRGHLHAGIAPWNRGKGYGTKMLSLALQKCKAMGMQKVQITPFAGNSGAVQTILRNGGVLLETFCDDGRLSERYEIDLERSR